MRRLLALAAAIAIPALAMAQPSPPPGKDVPLPPPPRPPPPTADQILPETPGRAVTTDQANRAGMEGVMTAPLRDMNAIRTQIPMVLRIAAQDPYARPRPNTCRGLIRAVEVLDNVLGADLDEPPSPDQRDLTVRSQELAIDVLGSTIRGVMPMRSWVRRLTGADQHDREVVAAITAGQVRRAYLKGLGESRGCPRPATPRHLASPPPPPEPPRRGPRFPTRR